MADIGVVIGLLIVLIIVIGIIAGIVTKVKESVVEPIQKAKLDTKIASFKYEEFIKVLQVIAPEAKVKRQDEFSISYLEVITNGVQPIGHFDYRVEDKMKLVRNSVGEYKVHDYTVTINCILKPSVDLKHSKHIGSTLDEQACRTALNELKNNITNEVAYKDAIKVNKLK